MRALAALESIKSQPIENGFLANQKTGKVSQKVTGDAYKLDILGGLKAGKNWRVLQRRNIAVQLHNHPGRHIGTLSPGDYAGGFQVAAIDKSGNMSRGKSKLPALSDREAAETFHQSIADNIHSQQIKKWRESGTNKPFPRRADQFLRYHYANKTMAQKGINTYRAKLAPSVKAADRVIGGSYAKAAEKAYRKEYFSLPTQSRLREKLPHPGHRKTILSPKAIAQQSRPWEERHPLRYLKERRRQIAIASQPSDWVSKLKMKAGIKVKPIPVSVPPVSQAVAQAAAKQAVRGNRIVARRL